MLKVGKHSLIKNAGGIYELQGKNKTVLTISDLHCKYQHRNAFKFLRWLNDHYRPDVVVCMGDEAEMAPWNFHSKNPEMPGGKDEYKETLDALAELYDIFPNALSCVSNHTSLPYRKAFEAGLLPDFMKGYNEILKAPPGWFWADRFLIDGVAYEHGELVSGRNGAWSAMIDNGCSTAIGHIHGHGGVTYTASPFNTRFALNTGCLIDVYAMAQKYGAKYRKKATIGTGVVMGGTEAHFIRMPKHWL